MSYTLQSVQGSSIASQSSLRPPAADQIDSLLMQAQSSPLQKLSIDLFKTYKRINEVYYAKKKRRLQSIQQKRNGIPPNGVTVTAIENGLNSQMASSSSDLYKAEVKPLQPISKNDAHAFASTSTSLAAGLMATSHVGVAATGIQNKAATLSLLTSGADTSTDTGYNKGYDDANYHYIIHKEEILLERYQIKSLIGKGSFGQVVKAFDMIERHFVAIKIIRNKEPFLKLAAREINLLKMMNSQDCGDDILLQTGKEKIVKLKSSFVWRKHICLVFELLSHSLYEVLSYTSFRGVSLNLTRKFAQQICAALNFIAQKPLVIMHCDLKPENILLCSTRGSAIKLVDFGSSFQYGSVVMDMYIQSRFYRSPEVLLGLWCGLPIDMWSLGCILVEMHTGHPLFEGKNEFDQLAKIIDLLGMPPSKYIEKSPRWLQFFTKNQNNEFVMNYKTSNPKRTLDSILGTYIGGPMGTRKHEAGHSPEDYAKFINLIMKMLEFDAHKRIKPSEALEHEFLKVTTEQSSQSASNNYSKSKISCLPAFSSQQSTRNAEFANHDEQQTDKKS